MSLEVLDSPAQLADRAAQVIARSLQAAVDERGRATLAVSGGSTPGRMLTALARRDLPWERIEVFQVDERIAAPEHPDRNLGLLRSCLLVQLPGPGPRVHPLPVELADPDVAATRAAVLLAERAGDPPVLDVVQLGLGADGHTASLVPGDPALAVTDRDIAVTGPYQGRRRLTATFPLLARARQRVWLVSGGTKAGALARVLAGDRSLPAARVPTDHTCWLVDRDAAARLSLDPEPDHEESRP